MRTPQRLLFKLSPFSLHVPHSSIHRGLLKELIEHRPALKLRWNFEITNYVLKFPCDLLTQ